MKIRVIDGDISIVKADALITAINSGASVAGSVDFAVYRRNTHYHTMLQEAIETKPLAELSTFVATAPVRTRLAFGDIVFVIDDTSHPLRRVVSAGLTGAHAAEKQRVCMPVMRSGAALGRRENTIKQVVNEIGIGIRMFRDETKRPAIKDLTIVTYDDPDTLALLRRNLRV